MNEKLSKLSGNVDNLIDALWELNEEIKMNDNEIEKVQLKNLKATLEEKMNEVINDINVHIDENRITDMPDDIILDALYGSDNSGSDRKLNLMQHDLSAADMTAINSAVREYRLRNINPDNKND